MTKNKWRIFRDVSVINMFDTGSDNRLVRGSLNLSTKTEWARLMKLTLRPSLPQVEAGCENFRLELRNRFTMFETVQDVDDATNSRIRVKITFERIALDAGRNSLIRKDERQFERKKSNR